MQVKSFPLALVLICLPLAAESRPANDAQLQSLYAKSGMQIQVEQMPLAVQEGFDQQVAGNQSGKYLDGKIQSAVRNSFLRAFVPGKMKKIILDELGRRLSSNEVNASLEWYNSPRGVKIAKLEEVASSQSSIRKFPAYVSKLRNNPPDPGRVSAVQRLDRVSRATEINVEIAMATAVATFTALNVVIPNGNPSSIKEMKSALEKSRPQMERNFRAYIRNYFLYTYRSLSDSDLDSYLKFVESNVGKLFYEAATAGLVRSFVEAIANIEGAIAAEISAQKI